MSVFSLRHHNIFFKFLVVVWVMIDALPILQYNSPLIVNAFVVIAIYAYLMSSSKNLLNDVLKILPFAILVLLDFIFGLLNGKTLDVFSFIYTLFQFCLLPLVALEVIRTRDFSFAKLILFSFLICYIVTGVTTYIGCTLFPGASRDLAAAYSFGEFERIALYKRFNIGGFEYIYCLPILCPLIIFMAKNTQSRWVIRIMAILLYAGVFFVILRSEYTTATLCVLFSAFCFILSNKNTRVFTWVLVISMVLLIVLREYLGDALISLADAIDSDTMSPRLEDVGSIFKGGMSGVSSSDANSRQEAYLTSWNAFLSSPLWGTGEFADGHSFLLRYLAKYGLIGFVIIVYLLRRIYNYSIKPSKDNALYSFLFVAFLIQIVLIVLNPLLVYTNFIVIFPLFALVQRNKING